MRNDNHTVKDFEIQARSNKMTMDKLNRAYYGFTVDELIMAAVKRKEGDHGATANSAQAE